ncbi:putative aarF domain-containing protein kinase 2-like [Vespula squamosa]|uniref:AarF domain-containing protein kinase 2-like n=1 Tax=Vespula squamosa TaxID=30214 RepID=A0ABD2AF10_VESSQ
MFKVCTRIVRILNVWRFSRFQNGGYASRKSKYDIRRENRCHSTINRLDKVNPIKRMIFNVIFTVSHESNVRNKERYFRPLVKVKENGGFFSGIAEAILIIARLVVIMLAAIILATAFLMIRLTNSEVFPDILRRVIIFLGPTFIKFGQWMSTRKDLFPENVCNSLTHLQRNASCHSWLYTKNLLKATYGPNWRDIFVKFEDEIPIGSGCCAQVYKAWVDLNVHAGRIQEPRLSCFVEIIEYLNMGHFFTILEKIFTTDENEKIDKIGRKLQPVAVKVLHPGIKNQIKRDLKIMRIFSKLATYVVPELHWLSLTDCIDEFSLIMEQQVDMKLEADNLIRFTNNFVKTEEIVFPRPYLQFTRNEILVETFHEGSPISDYIDYENNKVQRKLAKLGITMILKMVFSDNFIHCDLHPGNILVQEVKKPRSTFLDPFLSIISSDYTENDPKLVILDCGLVVSLNNRCRKHLRDIFRSVLMGNGELAAEYILEHTFHMTPDPDGFKTTMNNIVTAYLKNPGNFNNVNVSTVVSELFSAMVRHRVKQDGSFSSVILSMVVIEGLGRSLDPNIDIFSEVLPFVFNNTVYG